MFTYAVNYPCLKEAVSTAE